MQGGCGKQPGPIPQTGKEAIRWPHVITTNETHRSPTWGSVPGASTHWNGKSIYRQGGISKTRHNMALRQQHRPFGATRTEGRHAGACPKKTQP